MEVIFHGRVDELYDDNSNASGTEPKSDWVTNLMLGINLMSEMRELDVQLSGNVYQQYCVKNKERNSNYQDMMLSIKKSFSENVSLSLTDAFQHYPESKSFTTLFGQSDEGTGYMSNNGSVNLSVYVTSELFFNADYTNSIMKNDSSTMTDSVLHNGGGSIGYSFDSANIVQAGYMYNLMKYDDGDQSTGHRGYAQYEKFLTRQLRSILLGGYDYIKTTEGIVKSSRWIATLVDDVDKNNQLEISFLKENTISNISNDIFDNWRVSGSLRREISERTSVSASAFYGEGTYKYSKISDKLIGASIALSFDVTEFVNFNMGYTHTRSKSNTPGIEENAYNRNQVSAGLSAVY